MGKREEWLVHLFCRRMKKIFHQNVAITDVCYTSSGDLLRRDYVKNVNPSMNIHTLSYSNHKGDQWNAGFMVKKDSWKIVFELWSKNGEPIAFELYDS